MIVSHLISVQLIFSSLDRHANATEAERKEHEKKFKEVGEAYGILSDAKKRQRLETN